MLAKFFRTISAAHNTKNTVENNFVMMYNEYKDRLFRAI